MTDRLTRPPETKRLPLMLKDVDGDGCFVGYASLFGREDLSHDMVAPGAFAASISRRGLSGIKMLWHHDPAEPIGRWLDIREDERGLAVRGRLLTDLTRGAEALVLLRSGTIDGLSIGFRTVRARTERKAGIRHLLEVDLWEISIVTFPMLPEARIAAVKGTLPGQRRPPTPISPGASCAPRAPSDRIATDDPDPRSLPGNQIRPCGAQHRSRRCLRRLHVGLRGLSRDQ